MPKTKEEIWDAYGGIIKLILFVWLLAFIFNPVGVINFIHSLIIK